MGYEFSWADCDGDDLIWGQLTDGTFFLGCSWDEYDHTVWFSDNNLYDYAFGDDCDPLEDAVELYSTGELEKPENYQFWKECLAFINTNPNLVPYKFDWVETIDPQYANYGQLVDGTYFMAGGYRFNARETDPKVIITDANPSGFFDADMGDFNLADYCDLDWGVGDYQWLAAHTVKELSYPENINFWVALENYCIKYGYWV